MRILSSRANRVPRHVLLSVSLLLFGGLPLSAFGETADPPAKPAAGPRDTRFPDQDAGAGLTLSRLGATGLIRIPTAAVTPDGQMRVAFFARARNHDITRKVVGTTNAISLNMGFLPGFEIGATIGDITQNHDLTLNAKAQLLKETARYPAFSIGVGEYSKRAVNQAGQFPSYKYGVLSKRLFGGLLNATAGVRNQGNTRLFTGLEVGPIRFLSLVAEHDGRDVNYGARVALFRNQLQLAVQHLDGDWRVMSGIRFSLGSRERPAEQPVVELPKSAEGLSDDEVAKKLLERLAGLGLENLDVRIARGEAGRIEVGYENRSFPHSEMDALARVMASAASFAPEGVSRLAIRIKRIGIPILHVACGLEDYRAFLAGRLSERDFAQGLAVGSGEPAAEKGDRSAPEVRRSANPSYGHADLFLRPGISTQIATERYLLAVGTSIRPDLNLPVARGLTVNARADLPLAGQLRPDRATIDRAAVNLFTATGGPFLLHLTGGRYPGKRDGGLLEGLWTPDRLPLQMRASVGVVERTDDAPQKSTLLGEARYYLPALDLSLRVSGGRYLDNDTGVTVELMRRFGNTEIGLQYRDTSSGRVGVIALGIPLGPPHLQHRPSNLRVRPPDYLDYQHRSLLTRNNLLRVAVQTGNELNVGSAATGTLLDRDRLNREYIVRSLILLRQLAR